MEGFSKMVVALLPVGPGRRAGSMPVAKRATRSKTLSNQSEAQGGSKGRTKLHMTCGSNVNQPCNGDLLSFTQALGIIWNLDISLIHHGMLGMLFWQLAFDIHIAAIFMPINRWVSRMSLKRCSTSTHTWFGRVYSLGISHGRN